MKPSIYVLPMLSFVWFMCRYILVVQSYLEGQDIGTFAPYPIHREASQCTLLQKFRYLLYSFLCMLIDQNIEVTKA